MKYLLLLIAILPYQCLALVYDEGIIESNDSIATDFEYFPFVLYDTDIGFGGGIKLFLLNQFEKKRVI